ncbi:aldehyde dehydrogenase family protein [Acinetobacter pseudolwoffii]|uniref:aldehyde dehydrogenase family protein n=1 Tax=Acinetobacter pseudolwoffii TaxID=2053287 RepID=UPI002574FBB4|nr:aldehyde dehydrogenase family protein [Acinetobacter pseudolwoffii]MDM1341484.1 aldehyde dehydrogenase family protein [Acinetobacter pseudolwoffii]
MNKTLKTSYINGAFIQSTAEMQCLENRNPAHPEQIIDVFARADEALTAQAIDAAYQAKQSWGMSNPMFRSDLLDKIGTRLLEKKQDLGELLAKEEGKTLKEAILEVDKAGRLFKFYAQEALHAVGEKYQSVRDGVTVDVIAQPVGVVGVICPWNFPMAIPAWKIAPALCYGNTVVFKPAELVPSSAWELAKIIHEAGVPAGVFNMLIGPGRAVGDTILRSDKINAVTFTGSENVGRQVAKITAERMIPAQLEMGGKNPLIILDDADLDLAVTLTLQGAFFSTGQRCTATSRVIVTEGIYPKFIEKLTHATQALKVGDPLVADTDIGPVVDAKQLAQNLKYIQIGCDEGATLVCGDQPERTEEDGFYFNPVIFTNVTREMKIFKEEIFGPILSVIQVEDYNEAFEVAEDSLFGLSAGICTTSLKYAADFQRRSSSGMVMVNLTTAGVDHHVPFGGNKSSSFGPREQGTYAKQFFTKVKTAYQLPHIA